jgi:hypothetical protein
MEMLNNITHPCTVLPEYFACADVVIIVPVHVLTG